jgi:hypothetical protein
MADSLEVVKGAAQPIVPKASLVNPFHEPSRQQVEAALESLSRGNESKRICTIPGSSAGVKEIPVLHSEFVASWLVNIEGMMKTKSDAKALNAALRKDEDFIIAKVQRADGTMDMIVIAPASKYLPPDALVQIRANRYTGAMPSDIEKIPAAFLREKATVLEIYVGRPVNCIDMVNRALGAAGENKIDTKRPGYALDAALAQNKAITWREWGQATGPEGINPLLADAKTGDVIFFLREEDGVESIADARAEEKKYGDKVIWLDRLGKPVDVSAMKDDEKPSATAFEVGHLGMYGGLDKKTGQPLVQHAHVFTGDINKQPLPTVLTKNISLWPAFAVVPLEFFKKSTGEPSLALAVTSQRCPF